MIPSNSLNLREWFVFAEHLAANHDAIQHSESNVAYARMSFPEMQGTAWDNLNSPALLADVPESSGVDNASNNLLAKRYLAFTIVKRLPDNYAYTDVIDAELVCETIAVEVLARLRAERIHRGGNVFADVDMNAWEGDAITPFLSGGWAGYRLMVPTMVNDQRLKYDPARWIDGIGDPLLRDLTGLSCTNLNHPGLGLTLNQRLQCILPQYNFADQATLDALTSQQRVDLAAEFDDDSDSGGGYCQPLVITTNDNPFDTLNDPCIGNYNVPVVNEEDEPTGAKDGTVHRVPTYRSLAYQVTNGTVEEVNIAIISSGKKDDVVAGLVPTYDPEDVIKKVYDVMTPEQKAEFAVTVQLVDSAANNIGSPDAYTPGTDTTKTAPDGTVQLKDSDDADIGRPVAVRSGQTDLPITAPDATIQLVDTAANNIGLPTGFRSNSSTPLTAPDGTVQRKDSAGNDIGSPISVRSNQTLLPVTCPDGTVVVKNLNGTTLGSPTVRSNGSANYNAPIPLKFLWQAGDADTVLWTVTDDEAGTYATYTPTGTNGTLTYSLNGAGYAALSGTIVLAVNDTITVRRTTTTNAGSVKWVP